MKKRKYIKIITKKKLKESEKRLRAILKEYEERNINNKAIPKYKAIPKDKDPFPRTMIPCITRIAKRGGKKFYVKFKWADINVCFHKSQRENSDKYPSLEYEDCFGCDKWKLYIPKPKPKYSKIIKKIKKGG